jgi:hypothetical protein
MNFFQNKIIFLGLVMFLSLFISPVLAHGGDSAQPGEISLSLEEIYVITLLAMLITPLLIFKVAKIKDTKFIYVLLAFGFAFLTIDYLVLKFIIFV